MRACAKWQDDSSSERQSGFTIMELLIYMFLSLIVVQAIAGTVLSFRLAAHNDTIRTRLDQNLASAARIVTQNLTQAGEYLSKTFPAIELASGTPDTLTIRKGKIQQTLSLCKTLGSGATDRIYVSTTTTGAPSSCVLANMQPNFTAWEAYRTANGNTVKAFIYDVTTKVGEFFDYTLGTTGTEYYLTRGSGTWANSYTPASTTLYLIEELKITKTSDRLEVIKDGNTSNPLKIMFGLTDFQATITKSDSTVVSAFTRTDLWSDIAAIDITLTGQEVASRKTFTRTATIKVFPRNIIAQGN